MIFRPDLRIYNFVTRIGILYNIVGLGTEVCESFLTQFLEPSGITQPYLVVANDTSYIYCKFQIL